MSFNEGFPYDIYKHLLSFCYLDDLAIEDCNLLLLILSSLFEIDESKYACEKTNNMVTDKVCCRETLVKLRAA